MKKLLCLLLLLCVGCAQTNPMTEFVCEQPGFSGSLNHDKTIFTFHETRLPVSDNLESDKIDHEFEIINDPKQVEFIKDVELKKNQFIVILFDKNPDTDNPFLYAVTENNYPYFRPLYNSHVTLDTDNKFIGHNFHFVMPCVSKTSHQVILDVKE